MPKLCNIDIKHRPEIRQRLSRFVRKLKKTFSVEAVYLFGSWATGETHEGSDIDLLVIGDFQGKIFDRIAEILKLTDLPVEPLVYTPAEFQRLAKTNSFLKGILKTAHRL